MLKKKHTALTLSNCYKSSSSENKRNAYLFQDSVTAQKMGKKEGGAKSVVDKVLEVIRVQKSPGGSSRQALLFL